METAMSPLFLLFDFEGSGYLYCVDKLANEILTANREDQYQESS